ncbi:MAG: hypothetical protein GEV05_03560 [Betaproteobacteria bacterium]|nr:hypothetical protein [Betaproteobacteria bacterium]
MSRERIRTWTWPTALAILTTSGLISALVSEAWGDVWSWLGLGIPVLVIGWFAWHPERPGSAPYSSR